MAPLLDYPFLPHCSQLFVLAIAFSHACLLACSLACSSHPTQPFNCEAFVLVTPLLCATPLVLLVICCGHNTTQSAHKVLQQLSSSKPDSASTAPEGCCCCCCCCYVCSNLLATISKQFQSTRRKDLLCVNEQFPFPSSSVCQTFCSMQLLAS